MCLVLDPWFLTNFLVCFMKKVFVSPSLVYVVVEEEMSERSQAKERHTNQTGSAFLFTSCTTCLCQLFTPSLPRFFLFSFISFTVPFLFLTHSFLFSAVKGGI
jgi:hypothetical protein